MVKVLFLSAVLNDGDIISNAIELPEFPVLGDFVNITDWENRGVSGVTDYLLSIGKSGAARVTARNWGIYDDNPILFVFLGFDDLQ